jgi:hypothetical protein
MDLSAPLPPLSLSPLQPQPSPSATPPTPAHGTRVGGAARTRGTTAVNFATEWLDERSRVCPKTVDYASQCPKGHALVPFSGAASAQPLMCRVCHMFAEREHASDWLVCKITVIKSCAGYAVCDCCVSALRQAPSSPAGGGDFPSLQVCCMKHVHPLQECLGFPYASALPLRSSRYCRACPSLTSSG